MKRVPTLLCLLAAACPSPGGTPSPSPLRTIDRPGALADQCKQFETPRVEEVTPNVLVAVGYDLANVILIRTAEGNIIVDAAMSPERAAPIRAALLERAPGPIRALVFTHSHIDHVGGASVWLDEGTEIWATEDFRDNFLRQYSLMRPSQTRRGDRQFGTHVSAKDLPCSAIGRRPDIDAAGRTGARLPTHTFQTRHELKIGGTVVELVAAPGETEDQLFVWIPDERVLLPGDNFYSAFPNLYTIRGTRPRPVSDWITSLDEMRRRQPEHLVGSHTAPITGAETVADSLRDYRDAIQWVRDATVRHANAGREPEDFASRIGLPPSLSSTDTVAELYGQVDWSARAIYSGELGWFNGDATTLYSLPSAETARREVAAMGGNDAVVALAETADDPKWALHVLGKLQRAGAPQELWEQPLRQRYEDLAEQVANTNGRAYLLQAAHELSHPPTRRPRPVPDDPLLAEIPLPLIFSQMSSRLEPAKARGVYERVTFVFSDESLEVHVTIRNGIAEVTVGDPLPGTPPAVARVTTDGMTWRRLAVKKISRTKAISSRSLRVDHGLAFRKFMSRFDVD